SIDAAVGSGHVGSAELTAFVEDDPDLAGERRAAIAAHLAECAACAEDARLVRVIPRTRSVLMRRLGLAAALAGVGAALGLFVVARRSARPSAPRPETATVFAAPRRGPGTEMVLPPGPARAISVLLPLDAPAGSYRLRIERPEGVVEPDGVLRAAD